MERCYRCGWIKCETYRGYGEKADHDHGASVPCPDCEDGWKKAEVCRQCGGQKHEFLFRVPTTADVKGHPGFKVKCDECEGTGKRLGTDPSIICPACKKEAA